MTKNSLKIKTFLGIACFVCCLLGPLASVAGEWSVGIYDGPSPLAVAPVPGTPSPVLTRRDVQDLPARFVADPFLLKADGSWYLFFEVLNELTQQGDIGYASSDDGLDWTYRQIVLDEPFHLSYPHVFEWQGEYYLVPESHHVNAILLYRAVEFPTRWEFFATLVSGRGYRDSSLFHVDDVWWMFTATGFDTLYLFYADELTGPWIEHPESPLIQGDANIARPGGRVVEFDGRLLRMAQDDDPTYGNQVRAFEITTLSKLDYAEFEVPESPVIGATGSGWNANGMHHLDALRLSSGTWRAAVDGLGDPTPPSLQLLCSEDDRVDGSDPVCAGGEFADRLWVCLWPESDIGRVDFFLDGAYARTENYPPWELNGGRVSVLAQGPHEVHADVSLQSGATTSVTATFLVTEPEPPPPPIHALLCSEDDVVDGGDPVCADGEFPDRLWVYLWPESDVDQVYFYLDGTYARTENFAPWELNGGRVTALTPGSHTVQADVMLPTGETETVVAPFAVTEPEPPPPPSSFTLLCSTDSVRDGGDPVCTGGEFPARLWVYLWPESGAARVYFYLDGAHVRTENFAPWDLNGGRVTVLTPGVHEVRAEVALETGAAETVVAAFTVQ